MAEVLITLGIIGVVAAMTIPTLVVNYQKKVTLSKLQKAQAILSNIALNGYSQNGYSGLSGAVSEAKTREFLEDYWFKFLKSPQLSPNNVCPYDESGECRAFKQPNGNFQQTSIMTLLGAGRAYFTTQDGISYFLFAIDWEYEYNENGDIVSQTAKYINTQAVSVDLNGPAGPNEKGKDVFDFLVDFSKGIAYTKCNAWDDIDDIKTNCTSQDGGCCAEWIRRSGWRIPDDYPY